jgi:hypothetical protein
MYRLFLNSVYRISSLYVCQIAKFDPWLSVPPLNGSLLRDLATIGAVVEVLRDRGHVHPWELTRLEECRATLFRSARLPSCSLNSASCRPL